MPQAEAPAQWLRRLWERMVAMYGHAWTSVNGLTPQDVSTGALTISGDTWAKSLAGLTGPEFGVGLEACLAEGGEFPPSAPRFRSMCLGIPSFAAVRLEITAPDADRSPFTRSVWMFVDGFAYRQATSRDADRILRDAYELAKESRMRGAPLPESAEAVLGQGKTELRLATPEQTAAHIDAIRKELGA